MTEDPLDAPQRDVQRLLGRCLIRLQQYERVIKLIVAHHELSGPMLELEAIRAARIASTGGQTLGTLVGQLMDSYVVTQEVGANAALAISAPEQVDSVSIRTHLTLSDDDHQRVKHGLKELVQLRNNLVHHFIDQHNIWTAEGCLSAQDALAAAYNQIDERFEQLREWAKHMDSARSLTVALLESDAIQDLIINGIAPDGSVDWPASGIVSALREATSSLAVDGWTLVKLAEQWVTERYPDQCPSKYGCTSWRQVVHESRVFELRYREVKGQRAAWYRELPEKKQVK
ncbi:hypothetical protein C7S18_14650 [Ahniella affigens]|uniref:HTH OST-type domain-containing protein n=1 Tax=Ahniella affigens TaxID=2021234 RepID=A0A2P1PU43_9GAMM|nr:OST-HTH/LOTUS domain-containing protein [Ahniella affigens]AVP98351.1 hypothetical protein C7S18_14650 [Ahniella affigens]